jgi:hypothetical protein
MIAVSKYGAARAILTNVQVLAVKAGIGSVSTGLAEAAVLSSKSLKSPALVPTVLLTHISMVSYLERSLLVIATDTN